MSRADVLLSLLEKEVKFALSGDAMTNLDRDDLSDGGEGKGVNIEVDGKKIGGRYDFAVDDKEFKKFLKTNGLKVEGKKIVDTGKDDPEDRGFIWGVIL